MMLRNLLHRGAILLAVQALFVASAHGQCRTDATPPNVILLVADDFGWSDLPFFNPPINWKDGLPSVTKQYRNVRPELNRYTARLMANRDDGHLQQFQPPPLAPGETPPPPYPVIPLDATADPPTEHQYVLSADCSASIASCPTDVLRGFGGLRDLSLGISFSRFYAASAICASTRATIFSGRYPQRTGVQGNGGKLPPDEVTIAEYLQQGCSDLDTDPDQAGVQPPPCFGWRDNAGMCCKVDPSGGACPANELAPCYRTGLIGKWHLGESEQQVPWAQGFTEFVGHPRGCCRGHFSRTPLTCSPGPNGEPLYVGPEAGGACDPAALTSSRDCCDRLNKYYVPGRGDRATVDDPLPCDDDSNEPQCSAGSQNEGAACLVDVDCPGGFCWRGGFCLSGPSDGDPCSTDVQCADPSCAASCADPETCKTGCFYQHKCGCNYGVRAYRDLALNFIQRHCGEPFFLTIAYNATHIGHNAPYRTTRHYRTQNVGTKAKFWGVAEELDATVGRIVNKLEDLGLDDKTLVFFTADQGRPAGNYGSPTLRGGKGGVFDGGIRIGLLARAKADALFGPLGVDDLDAHLGSHVDILPTIAEAANYPVSALPNPNVFDTCADGGGCLADCQGQPCLHHYVDGRSFYGLLSSVPDPDPTPTPARDLTFATYGGIAVIARPKLVPTPTLGSQVCGFVDQNADHVVIRGGSCAECTNCSNTPCQILGKVCVASGVGHCVAAPGYNGPPVTDMCTADADCVLSGSICVHTKPSGGFERCKNGCSGGRSCVEIHTDCNKCLDTAWKLKSGPSEGQPLPVCGSTLPSTSGTDRLFDLATNPEEQDNLDCKDSFPLVWCDLKRKLLNWDACSSAANCEAEGCEGFSNPPTCLQ